MQYEWYFNIIEYGPDIYGIKNAALYYFDSLPSDMTRDECIALARILTNPLEKGKQLKMPASEQ